MNVIGVVDIRITAPGINITQSMKVIDCKTYKNVILGRDFLANFNTVAFNFANNSVLLGSKNVPCVHLIGTETVRLQSSITLPGRAESVINVNCKKSMAFLTADLEPASIAGTRGV